MTWASIQSLPLDASGSITVVGLLLVIAAALALRKYVVPEWYADKLEKENEEQKQAIVERDEENRQLVRDITEKLHQMCERLEAARRELSEAHDERKEIKQILTQLSEDEERRA